MTKNLAIHVKDLGKSYRIGQQRHYKTFRDAITGAALYPIRCLIDRSGKNNQYFWALKDVSFDVERGEVVGIIGRNGAGKSTLLKILSRITAPTEGSAMLYGKVGSLLEVGTGFHPELTGRENIYMSGSILGMRKSEIDDKFDEIIKFADIDKFTDTPVKRYSSGMYVRLAFAVAANLDMDILLIDEILAVGDIEFQKKCLGKMDNLANEGRTVLFVSHNMPAILKLCPRTIIIQSGKVHIDGESENVVSNYISNIKNISGEKVIDDPISTNRGNDDISLRKVSIINSKGEITPIVYIEEQFWIELEYQILRPLTGAWIGLSINTQNGEVLFCSGDINVQSDAKITRKPGIYKSRCLIPSNLLNQGTFNISLIGHIPGEKMLFNESSILNFEVIQSENLSGKGFGMQPGLLRPILSWTIENCS